MRPFVGGASASQNSAIPVIRRPFSIGVNTTFRSDSIVGIGNRTPGSGIITW